MRALFVCVPQAGHVRPLMPLASAFVAQDDDVLLASGPDVAATAAEVGLAFRAVGPGFGDWFARLAGRTRGKPGDGLPPDHIGRYFLPRLFGEIGADAVIDDLLSVVDDFQPHVIVHDTSSFAAPLAAACRERPSVHHLISPVTDPTVLDLTADALSPLWRSFGLDVPRDAGVGRGPSLTIFPGRLDPGCGAVPGSRPMRGAELPQSAPQPLPVSFDDPSRPLVYLTLGTFSNTNQELFALVASSLASEPLNLLITVGSTNDPADLGELPGNVHVERFLAQASVLPHCTAVVHHAGSGTLLGAVAHGLPCVALPQSADNFDNAGQLAASRVGRVLMPAEVTPESLREAVRDVMDDPSYRWEAQETAAEIATMPAPAEVAASLRRQFGG